MELKYPCRSVTFAETAAFPSGGPVCYLRGGSWAPGALVGPFPVKLSYAAVPT